MYFSIGNNILIRSLSLSCTHWQLSFCEWPLLSLYTNRKLCGKMAFLAEMTAAEFVNRISIWDARNAGTLIEYTVWISEYSWTHFVGAVIVSTNIHISKVSWSLLYTMIGLFNLYVYSLSLLAPQRSFTGQAVLHLLFTVRASRIHKSIGKSLKRATSPV